MIYIRSLLLFRVIERSLKGFVKGFVRFERLVKILKKIFSLGFLKILLVEKEGEKGKEKGGFSRVLGCDNVCERKESL